MPTIDLVFNPASGSFSKVRLATLVEALEDQGFLVTQTPSQREPTPISGTADLVCVHGGDGTLRDTVQALGRDAGRIPLAIAPSGTVNLVARELGYARAPRTFARQLREAWDRGAETWVHAPLYALGDMPVVSCLSIGPDSHAVAEVSSALKARIGRFAYVVATLRQLRKWPRNPLTVKGELADGTPFSCEAEAVVASHGALYAGPFRLSPHAALAADSFELITLGKSTRLATLAFALAAVFRMSMKRLKVVEIRTVRRVRFDRCVSPVQVDGDHMPDCAFAIGPTGLTLRYVV